MVGRSMPKLASNRLVEMLERWGKSALAQRLGYFADLHGVDLQPGLRAALERLVRPGSRCSSASVGGGVRPECSAAGRLPVGGASEP